MNNFKEKADLVWAIADLLHGDYKPHEYVDVILPMTVLRRLDQAMEPTRADVREARAGSERKRLQEDGRKPKCWRDEALARIEQSQATAIGALAAQLDRERREVEALYAQYQAWLTETFTTVDQPYLRVVAVSTGS